ncbi:MAG: hypothetical protein Faunusvirus4_6 [Faunusvirus sp.]|jgi:hypothetical protein|uniref:Uncharacterized protein n=1 Tax=Faunusvirus sp. TaxID=2487766 RepID=A0A3G4ZWA3_9VIRU|nr:MAG: hypothetical protein Faunusvirus4_6 [Faunusvirus sp.]
MKSMQSIAYLVITLLTVANCANIVIPPRGNYIYEKFATCHDTWHIDLNFIANGYTSFLTVPYSYCEGDINTPIASLNWPLNVVDKVYFNDVLKYGHLDQSGVCFLFTNNYDRPLNIAFEINIKCQPDIKERIEKYSLSFIGIMFVIVVVFAQWCSGLR